MKLAITTESKTAITNALLALLQEHAATPLQLAVTADLTHVETQSLSQSTQRAIASQLMQIPGVKWVEQVDALPAAENQQRITAMLQAIPDPLLGINTKGQIVSMNQAAKATFAGSERQLQHMKAVFVSSCWQQQVNAAADSGLPVHIETTAGPMLLQVRALKNATDRPEGALLLFRAPQVHRLEQGILQADALNDLGFWLEPSVVCAPILSKAKTVAAVDAPLNLVGEAGTGKRWLAQACHRWSSKPQALFTWVDCQAISEIDLWPHLFGDDNQAGVLASNSSGTWFFSHLESMALHTQQRLLAVIETRPEVRLMASTQQPISQCESVHPDLASQLDVLQLQLPPLRDRAADIEALTHGLLSRFKRWFGRDCEVSPEAMSVLQRYHWPHNITQLEQALYQALWQAEDGLIQVQNLDLAGAISMETALTGLGLTEAVNEFEKHFLQHWYQKYPSTRKLARQLGVSHTTIAQKIKKYGLN